MQSNFIESTVRHGYFPVNLLHIFRTPFSKNGCMAASAVASTEILNCVSEQVRESGRTYSNWFTQEKLRMQNVSRNLAFVRIALKSLVSEEIGIRSIKRFPRRKYTCVLLKHMWHIDDYYKLKPFHFATYGTMVIVESYFGYKLNQAMTIQEL